VLKFSSEDFQVLVSIIYVIYIWWQVRIIQEL
jgi:hypothetical protein